MESKPWLSLEQAAELGAFPSVNSLQLWLHRWNGNPRQSVPVLRRRGKIETDSFLKALREDALQQTPKARVLEQMGAGR